LLLPSHADQTGWVDWFYVNERLNQDEYNFVIEYPWVDKTYPRVTRTYLILREDYEEPDPDATDPKYTELSLTDRKITRLEDPVLDSLFVGISNVFERVPAPIAYQNEKFESVLPYKFRVAVPAKVVTTVKEGAAQPPALGKGDWAGSEETNSFNRRTVKGTRRDLPNGGVTFISEKLTRDKQVAKVTESWKDEDQHITARPTLLDGDVEQVGDGTTIKSETEVDVVFPETRHAAEIPDPVPPEFRHISPTRTFAETTAGQVQPPELALGELSVVEDQKDTQLMRRSVVKRDPDKLPATLKDYELGGIHTHGSEFGGTLETATTLDKQPQKVEEGFDIIASSVKNIGSGLTLKKVTRLFTGGNGTGPYLELTDGGESYVDNPAIVFDGDRGSGAEGTATISEITVNQNDLDPGGEFTLTFASSGDSNGLMDFLGTRYNAGVWANPTREGGPVHLTATTSSTPTYASLARATDHDLTLSTIINPQPHGGSNGLTFDLGTGKSYTPNYVSIRGPGGDILAGSVLATKFEIWAFNTPADAVKVGGPFNMPAAGGWAGFALSATKGYRYLRINAANLSSLDSSDLLYPSLAFAEIEFYGNLVISPGVGLNFAYNGDAAGVFYYLGQRGGGGTWRNPQTNGDIVITAPYDALEFGTFDSMVDREASNTYLVERNHAEVWFDLKENRSLLLTSLLFQQRADYGSPNTEFYVQGSADGVTWEENQRCLVSYVAGSWTKIDTPNFTKPYRFFRLILPTNKGFLSIGELELYGQLNLDPDEVGGGSIGTYSVTGVNITTPGSGYADPPDVNFSGGGGSGAAGTAVLNDAGEVVGVTMTSEGSGYLTVPDVTFTLPGTGSGATAISSIFDGVVISIDVDDPGAGYSADRPPVVKIVSATGSGATATANVALDGTIGSITVVAGGSGYVLPPTVVLYPDTDPEADAVVGYPIDEITLTERGEDYTSAPAVHIAGSGSDATAIATVGFGVDSVQITDGGSGYTSTPTPVFTGNGSGAAGTVVLGKVVGSTAITAPGNGYLTEPEVTVSEGDAQFQAVIGRPILTIGLTDRGSGYTSNPTVTITGDGSGAAAHVIRSFVVGSIAVSAGGSGYTTAPTVAITAPTGEFPVLATAHAVLTGDAVTSIVIDNPGSGYLSAPTATLSGGDGTGATAGAVSLASGGVINSIVVDAAGSGYTEATVAITGGGGSGATAVIGLDTTVAGPIKKITITNPGTDYTAAPTLTIVPGTSGGSGATATASLASSGRVIGVTVTSPGELYTGVVTLSFTGGGGTGAAGTVALEAAGKVKEVTLLTTGSGFGDDTVITFTGGGGSGAAATVASSACGEVVAVQLTKPGGPFTTPPLVRFVGGQSTECPTDSRKWYALPDMQVERLVHTATLLPDGRVLVAGGSTNAGSTAACELFDPATDTWSPAADMNVARRNHAAVVLTTGPNAGKVLVMGGHTTAGNVTTDTSEIYDPVADTWTLAASMQATDAFFGGFKTAADVLIDGRVVALRGWMDDANVAQIYDPTANTWTTITAPPRDATPDYIFMNKTITTLPDGNALVGFDTGEYDDVNAYVSILDATTLTWTTTNPIRQRYIHAVQPLDNDKLLVIGGFPIGDFGAYIAGDPFKNHLYDPATDTWTDTGRLMVNRYGMVSTKLPNGDVLIVGGGRVTGPGVSNLVVTELYNTSTGLVTAAADMLHARRWHTATALPDGRVMACGGETNGASTKTATAEIWAANPRSAAAVYHLGSSWPTLIEEQTDPTEGIITRITKKIVPALTPLPDGFAESFPLDIYRSIHIVSKVDLHSLPKPEIYDTTQHVSFPPQLISCYPIWDSSRQQSTAGGADTGTNRGRVSAEVSVHGAIVLTTISGFRGAAMGRVERQFFGSLDEVKAATVGIEPTIIRPSSGTAILRSATNSAANEGLTYDQSAPLNIYGQPAQPGDPMPGGGTFSGSFNFASRAQSSGATGTSTQVKDINDVLTAGFNSSSTFKATNSSSADVLTASAVAEGSFTLVIPASNPTIIVPGKAVLAQVVIEKWRFGIFVRHLIYLQAPVI
jgi:hypothetical protein